MKKPLRLSGRGIEAKTGEGNGGAYCEKEVDFKDNKEME